MNAKKYKHIILIGMPGSGKSLLGQKLAKLLRLEFYDADVILEKERKTTIGEIFEQEGEKAFRQYESSLIKKLIGYPDALIALGGGGILMPANRLAIKNNNLVIYLESSSANLLKNLGNAENRPLIQKQKDKKTAVENLLAERESIYRESSHLTFCVDNLSPARLVKQIYNKIQQIS